MALKDLRFHIHLEYLPPCFEVGFGVDGKGGGRNRNCGSIGGKPGVWEEGRRRRRRARYRRDILRERLQGCLKLRFPTNEILGQGHESFRKCSEKDGVGSKRYDELVRTGAKITRSQVGPLFTREDNTTRTRSRSLP